jgi:hypothetical protein
MVQPSHNLILKIAYDGCHPSHLFGLQGQKIGIDIDHD